MPVRVETVGRERDNQAIAALAVRADPSGLKRTLFVSVANYSASAVARRLQILADGSPVTARDLALQPLSRADVVIDELPAGASVVEARITPADSTGESSGPADYLAVDDAAWAIVPPDRLRRVLLVGPGNVYLQNAFALLPNVELYGATAEQYASTTGKELFDLVVFDGFLPPELPRQADPRVRAAGDECAGRRQRHARLVRHGAARRRRSVAPRRGPDAPAHRQDAVDGAARLGAGR